MLGRPGSFAAYLEYTQRNRAAPLTFHASEPVDLLHLLSLQPDCRMSIGQLASASGRLAGAFHEMLKTFVKSGLVEVTGQPLEETVALTQKGREAANLA